MKKIIKVKVDLMDFIDEDALNDHILEIVQDKAWKKDEMELPEFDVDFKSKVPVTITIKK